MKSPQLFQQYWGRPEATAEAFDPEGYFMTGGCRAWPTFSLISCPWLCVFPSILV